jgi:PEGA domain
VTSDPPGASIYVDGIDSGKLTPSDVTLTDAQAGRPRVRLSLRRPGFRPTEKMIEATAFVDGGGTMTSTIDAKLVVQTVRPPTGGGTGGGTTNTGTGSGTGSAETGSGSAATGTGAGSGSGSTTGTTPPATGTGAGSGTGTGAGSATTPKPSSLDNPSGTSGTLPTELK